MGWTGREERPVHQAGLGADGRRLFVLGEGLKDGLANACLARRVNVVDKRSSAKPGGRRSRRGPCRERDAVPAIAPRRSQIEKPDQLEAG
jgi:hypothetical protein